MSTGGWLLRDFILGKVKWWVEVKWKERYICVKWDNLVCNFNNEDKETMEYPINRKIIDVYTMYGTASANKKQKEWS